MNKKYLLILALTFCLSPACVRGEEAAVRSDDALAYLNIDIEQSPGWVAAIKGGYQWKLFRNVGYTLYSGGAEVHGRSHNIARGGPTGTVSLGYNFGNYFPLTVGVAFGAGPAGKLNTHSSYNGYNIHGYQKVRIYTFDLSADYDFKNCTRWTPFVGLTAGMAFTSQHGKLSMTDGTNTYGAGYAKKKHTNFMVGARLGAKYKVNERVTLSLYSTYNYLGTLSSRSFAIGGGGPVDYAHTKKIRAHSVDVKAGLKITF